MNKEHQFDFLRVYITLINISIRSRQGFTGYTREKCIADLKCTLLTNIAATNLEPLQHKSRITRCFPTSCLRKFTVNPQVNEEDTNIKCDYEFQKHIKVNIELPKAVPHIKLAIKRCSRKLNKLIWLIMLQRKHLVIVEFQRINCTEKVKIRYAWGVLSSTALISCQFPRRMPNNICRALLSSIAISR